MVYATPFPYLFIYWLVSISFRVEFVLGIWNYIIINFMAISQKIIYTLLISCMNMNLKGIKSNRNLPTLLLLFTIFEHICLITFSDKSKPPMNAVQLMASKVLMFHENTELIPSVDCYDLYPGHNDPNKHIMLVLVGIPI